MPVAMVANAVTSMQAVVEKAKEIEEAERLEIILAFVTSILMFVPVILAGAGRLGFATLRSIIRMAGEVGDVALGIYGMIESGGNPLHSSDVGEYYRWLLLWRLRVVDGVW